MDIEELNKALKTSKELIENLEKANSLLYEFADLKNDVSSKVNPTGKIKTRYDVLELLLKVLEELRERQLQLPLCPDTQDDYISLTEKIEKLAKFLLEF